MQLASSTTAAVAVPTVDPFAGLPAFLLRPPRFDPPPPDPWRVVRARFGTELAVARALETELDLEAFCPRYRSRFVVRGRFHERLTVFLPSYVFSRFDPLNPYRWHSVHAIGGVFGVLPGSVSEAEMTALRFLVAELDDGSALGAPVCDLRRRFLPLGRTVRLVTGPFTGYDGEVTACDGLFAWIKIFGLLGRDTVIEVPADWCDPVESTSSIDSTVGGSPSDTGRNRRDLGPKRRRRKHRGSYRPPGLGSVA